MRRRHLVVGLIVIAAVAAGSVAALAGIGSGPGASSSQSPYLVPSQDGVEITSIFTTGDPVGGAVDGYRMVGIPDGLGVLKAKDGTFNVLMNHELSSGGSVRAHGASGSFVSQWSIEKRDGSVLAGSDLIHSVATWNTATTAFNAPATGVALNRLCSADLPAQTALWDKKSKSGYGDPLFLNGEESGAEGRAFAHALDGTSYELAGIGKYSHENVVANPSTGSKTVVVSTDDQGLPTGGQVYVYVGDKKKSGNPAQLAGLTGGTLYGIKIPGTIAEPASTGIASGTAFTAASLGNVASLTGAQLEAASEAAGVTRWQRPEDAAWDPKHPEDLYFVITADFAGKSKLYRLRFNDPANPAAGGTVDQLLDGTETGGTSERFHMLDNLAVDRHGRVVLQEDPGGNDYLARVWSYDIADDSLTEVAHFDPVRFSPASITKLTNDEESSGVIDAEAVLGKGWFLLDAQAHYAIPNYLVEGGQLLALKLPGGKDS